MATSNNVCLLATLHDPEGKLTQSASRVFRDIANLYQEILIDVTMDTDMTVRSHIGHFILSKADGIARARKRLLARAIEETDCSHFHLVDFDRLLYWHLNYPDELEATIRLIGRYSKLVIFGRMPIAFSSHPDFQYRTEKCANSIFATWYGKEIDVLSASRGIPRAIGEKIIERSCGDNPAYIDGEWPMIAGKDNLHYVEVIGLSYESEFFGLQRTDEDEVKLRLDNLNSMARLVYG